MTVIVGVGSPHGDDQLGWLAIDRLRPRLSSGTSAEKVHGGVEILEILEGHDAAVIIDSARPAGLPGTRRVFTWPCPELAQVASVSTHSLGVVEALNLAETIGSLPRCVRIHTIEAHDTSPGAQLSASVADRLDDLVDGVLRDLDRGDH
jgi:hydrogenase maturation protease